MEVSNSVSINDFIQGPVDRIQHAWGTQLLFLKRLDLIQSWTTGNKYYKLKHNIDSALKEGYTSIVSKGGMFSNHLEALAAACHHFHIECICMIRSYHADENNPTIQKLKKNQARIIFLDPDAYQSFDKENASLMFPGAMFIPEGGSNERGIRGASEIWSEIEMHEPTHLVISGGTMTTAAGLLSAVSPVTKVIIVPAWKGCTNQYVDSILSQHHIQATCEWELWPDYHFGGFAKYTASLADFMYAFSEETNIPLDPVYTGKMMYAIKDKVQAGYFSEQARIMAIHTGGLQGIEGFRYRDPGVWERPLPPERA